MNCEGSPFDYNQVLAGLVAIGIGHWKENFTENF